MPQSATDRPGAPPLETTGASQADPPGARLLGAASGPKRCTASWPAPARVRTLITLRDGGASRGPWGRADGSAGGWNLGARCGDDREAVIENRRRLRDLLPSDPIWLDQIHGAAVLDADALGTAPAMSPDPPAAAGTADAAVATRAATVLAVLTADCLPVLICDRAASVVGIAHAGWRGLAAGVVENTLAAMRGKLGGRGAGEGGWLAWLGPAISQAAFEVGDDVLQAFADPDPGAAEHFSRGRAPGKWQADLFGLARRRLAACGVNEVFGGGWCTVSDAARLYSFRRDRQTGRMASLIWLD